MKTGTPLVSRVRLAAAITTLALAATGCTYEAPLLTKATGPIDPAVLGVWQAVDPDSNDKPETMVVLRHSDSEYLVHYPTDADDGMYFRGYPIKVAGLACVQLELLGSAKGPETGKTRFHVVTYTLAENRLEIRTLNSEIVSSDLSDSDALREAFERHANDPALFHDPGVFQRVAR